ncbi:MAG: TIGR02996 domain-containing protein [Planctomycetes bacterium]|nr:TIGR02996 domain-containing protein [Planctomycetota bacterium]
MKDEQGFLAALEADPWDEALRLVYADWLEKRGEFLRVE